MGFVESPILEHMHMSNMSVEPEKGPFLKGNESSEPSINSANKLVFRGVQYLFPKVIQTVMKSPSG